MKFVQERLWLLFRRGYSLSLRWTLEPGSGVRVSPMSEITALAGGEGATESQREGFARADSVDGARREIRTFAQKGSESEAIADSDEELSKKILGPWIEPSVSSLAIYQLRVVLCRSESAGVEAPARGQRNQSRRAP